MSKPFNRIVRPAVVVTWHSEANPRAVDDVFAKIDWDGTRLSITGVEGPKRNGDCWGGCGQVVMHADEWIAGADFTAPQLARFIELWNRWHLNDMCAGSPAQREFLREHPVTATWPESHLDKARSALREAWLYSYGTAWLTESIPDEVLAELLSLPESTKTPAWV